MTYQVTVE